MPSEIVSELMSALALIGGGAFCAEDTYQQVTMLLQSACYPQNKQYDIIDVIIIPEVNYEKRDYQKG